eukprot:257077-Amphidinium_carterae.2
MVLDVTSSCGGDDVHREHSRVDLSCQQCQTSEVVIVQPHGSPHLSLRSNSSNPSPVHVTFMPCLWSIKDLGEALRQTRTYPNSSVVVFDRMLPPQCPPTSTHGHYQADVMNMFST